jgi:hypothetical protein
MASDPKARPEKQAEEAEKQASRKDCRDRILCKRVKVVKGDDSMVAGITGGFRWYRAAERLLRAQVGQWMAGIPSDPIEQRCFDAEQQGKPDEVDERRDHERR